MALELAAAARAIEMSSLLSLQASLALVFVSASVAAERSCCVQFLRVRGFSVLQEVAAAAAVEVERAQRESCFDAEVADAEREPCLAEGLDTFAVPSAVLLA